ncbi:MAG: metallophosphoesterase, partial [Spirochaeta sp.]
IIGDVHGHAVALEGLLQELGYRERHAVYRHPDPDRTAVFVGDIVDRGPAVKRSLEIVRRMKDAGTAYVVLGNHEYNLIGYHTPIADEKRTGYVRAHTQSHLRQCRQTLAQFADSPAELKSYLAWMMDQPLFLELPEIRVVHAAWHPLGIEIIRRRTPVTHSLTPELLQESARYGSDAYYAIEYLLKGVEIQLPEGMSYLDKEGTRRTRTRVSWWWMPEPPALHTAQSPVRLEDLAFPHGVVSSAANPEFSIPAEAVEHVPGYNDTIPVFVGHYWLTGKPQYITPYICCLDYSIAAGGLLTAYTYQGEAELLNDHFVQVDANGNPQ